MPTTPELWTGVDMHYCIMREAVVWYADKNGGIIPNKLTKNDIKEIYQSYWKEKL